MEEQRIKGTSDIEFQGKTLQLKFTWEALYQLEKATGKTVPSMFGADGGFGVIELVERWLKSPVERSNRLCLSLGALIHLLSLMTPILIKP